MKKIYHSPSCLLTLLLSSDLLTASDSFAEQLPVEEAGQGDTWNLS